MIMSNPHRIAITGASGTGKTTLAEALMQQSWFSRLVKTMIPEGSRELLKSLGYASFDNLTRPELREFQRLFFLRKQEAESNLGSYLVDRSFVDVAAIWVERDTFDHSLEIQNELVIPCSNLAKKYTLHIHVPDETFAFYQNGVRETDMLLHRRIATRVRRYLHDWDLPNFSLESSSVEMRVEEIFTEFEYRGLIIPPA